MLVTTSWSAEPPLPIPPPECALYLKTLRTTTYPGWSLNRLEDETPFGGADLTYYVGEPRPDFRNLPDLNSYTHRLPKGANWNLDSKLYQSPEGSLVRIGYKSAIFADNQSLSVAELRSPPDSVQLIRIIYDRTLPSAPVEAWRRFVGSIKSNEVEIEFLKPEDDQLLYRGNLGVRLWRGSLWERDLGRVPKMKMTGAARIQSARQFEDVTVQQSRHDPNAIYVDMDGYAVLDLKDTEFNELTPRTISTSGCATCTGLGLSNGTRALVAHVVTENGPPAALLKYLLERYFPKNLPQPTLRVVGNGMGVAENMGQSLIAAAKNLGLSVEEVDIEGNVRRGLGYSFSAEQNGFQNFRVDRLER